MAGVKRKRVLLSIEEKLEVVQMLMTSPQKVIAEKFGVGKSTVAAIKRMKQNPSVQECNYQYGHESTGQSYTPG